MSERGASRTGYSPESHTDFSLVYTNLATGVNESGWILGAQTPAPHLQPRRQLLPRRRLLRPMRAIGASRNITIPSSIPVPPPLAGVLQKPPAALLDAAGVDDAVGDDT